MERMTQQNEAGVWHVPAQAACPKNAATGPAIDRLAAYETVHAQLVQRQEEIAQSLEALRAQGKEKSVQFRELVGNKLLNTTLLAMLKAHGL